MLTKLLLQIESTTEWRPLVNEQLEMLPPEQIVQTEDFPHKSPFVYLLFKDGTQKVAQPLYAEGARYTMHFNIINIGIACLDNIVAWRNLPDSYESY